MSGPSEEGSEGAASREAAEWLVALDKPTVSTDRITAFYAWRRDPANARAYVHAEAVWHRSGDLRDDPEIRAAVAEAVSASGNSHRRSVFATPWAIGALVLAAALALWMFLVQPDHLVTRVGEQRIVSLEDGSRILIDADTDLLVRYAADARHVSLERGRARFTVHHGDPRPFTVDFGGARVVATGTRFDVRADPIGTSVALLDGTVRVQSKNIPDAYRDLVAGQAVSVAAGIPGEATIIRPGASDWSEGRIVFFRTPLGTALAEINRYSARKVVVTDPALLTEPISGTFTAREGKAFADTVAVMFDLHEKPSADSIALVR
ncbi:FecR family protein [Sphingomonas faeni]|uniref:FecR family protein n=1 Tax=Sphingomonas faeni TaxID=185950 RepID=UPI00277F38B1|nr:FecR domain-containing protein [Sphingomonas faeni]MDQ0839258.1 transmembrane sensor [Sphingomonas faeni]